MKLLGIFLTACVVIAAAQVAAAVLVIALAIGMIVAILARPRETLGFVTLLVIVTQPFAVLGLLALALVASLIGKSIEQSRR